MEATEQRLHTRWAWTLGTFFGTGFLRPGPGTWGSIAGLLLWLAAARFLHPTPAQLAAGTAIAAMLLLFAGIPAASRVAAEAATDDPQCVVADEVVGQWIALLPAALHPWWSWLLALLFFRFFDILKPPPARQFDRMHGGFGIMMDDVAAGIYAMILVWLAVHFFA